jgi:hypothetical protein
MNSDNVNAPAVVQGRKIDPLIAEMQLELNATKADRKIALAGLASHRAKIDALAARILAIKADIATRRLQLS